VNSVSLIAVSLRSVFPLFRCSAVPLFRCFAVLRGDFDLREPLTWVASRKLIGRSQSTLWQVALSGRWGMGSDGTGSCSHAYDAREQLPPLVKGLSMTVPRSRPFAQVDVFSSTPYLGNPVAVVFDAADLDDQAMQRLARWMNLSETTFVLPPSTPDADYRLRIFTPGGELPFAGHPTLGSAHAWLEQGGSPRRRDRIVQECAAGLVEVRPADPAHR
jgi:hypothetical protein